MELTEAETEYAVNVVKHIFDGHVVFQYNCTNTIPEQLLENVIIKLHKASIDYINCVIEYLNKLGCILPGHCYCGRFRG